ncbi:MAG: GTP cyclohydrolase [Flavobacteriaceae bacterium]|nr:GTP cyclohydrolase [Flavobacteriaceae bacterium]
MITIKEIHSKKEIKQFVKFPFSLYKNSKTWIPPIVSQEVDVFDKNSNPAFDTADAHFLLAYKNGKIVGRIAAIINWTEVRDQKIKKMRFGWYDVIDDIEVSRALLDKVNSIGQSHRLEFIEGPVGFSNLDKVGLVYEGFDHIGSMITWENHPYYVSHLEALGFKFEKGYTEAKFYHKNIDPKPFIKVNNIIKKRYGFSTTRFTDTKQILPYTDEMFDVFGKSYEALESYVEITPRQRAYFKKKFIPFLNPEYVKFVFNKEQKLIGFGIVTPSYAEALLKNGGKLWPFGFRHILRAKKKSKKVMFYLIGILPEYQKKGVPAIIFHEFYKEFTKKGAQEFLRGPELDNNKAIQQIWRHFKPEVYKRRATYRKDIV